MNLVLGWPEIFVLALLGLQIIAGPSTAESEEEAVLGVFVQVLMATVFVFLLYWGGFFS